MLLMTNVELYFHRKLLAIEKSQKQLNLMEEMNRLNYQREKYEREVKRKSPHSSYMTQ
mgnify:CR=1 FL=1